MAYGNYAPFYRGGYFNPMQTQTMPNMVENQNQFAQAYQTPMQNQQMQMQTPPSPMPMQTQGNDMLWVLGQTEAESYPVAPNNTVTLWDKNQSTIYIKSVNAQGIPSMRILDFNERAINGSKTPTEHVCKCGDKFISKEDLNAVNDKIQEVMCRLSDVEDKYIKLTEKPAPKTTKKTEDK